MRSSAELGAGASTSDAHDRPAKRQKIESLFRFSNSQRRAEGVRLETPRHPQRRQGLSSAPALPPPIPAGGGGSHARPDGSSSLPSTSLPDPQVVEGLTDCDTPDVPSRSQQQHELPQHTMPDVPATIGRELEFVSSQLCSQQLQSPLPDGAPSSCDAFPDSVLLRVACGTCYMSDRDCLTHRGHFGRATRRTVLPHRRAATPRTLGKQPRTVPAQACAGEISTRMH